MDLGVVGPGVAGSSTSMGTSEMSSPEDMVVEEGESKGRETRQK